MAKIFNLVINNKLLSLALGLALIALLKTTTFPDDQIKTHADIRHSKKHIVKSKAHKVFPIKDSLKPSGTESHTKISFEEELKKVQRLSENFPESKPELIAIITSANPYKSTDLEIKAHSTDEILQRKIGAVKIVALRELVNRELDKDSLKKDLISIARTANDPTITKVARAALKSVENDRSLFDDFRDGVDTQMPL